MVPFGKAAPTERPLGVLCVNTGTQHCLQDRRPSALLCGRGCFPLSFWTRCDSERSCLHVGLLALTSLLLLHPDFRLCPLSLDCGLMLTLPDIFLGSSDLLVAFDSVGHSFPLASLMAAPLVFPYFARPQSRLLLLSLLCQPHYFLPSSSVAPPQASPWALSHPLSHLWGGLLHAHGRSFCLLTPAHPSQPRCCFCCPGPSIPPRPPPCAQRCFRWQPHRPLLLNVFETLLLLLPELAANPLLPHIPPPSWHLAPSTSQAPSAQEPGPR